MMGSGCRPIIAPAGGTPEGMRLQGNALNPCSVARTVRPLGRPCLGPPGLGAALLPAGHPSKGPPGLGTRRTKRRRCLTARRVAWRWRMVLPVPGTTSRLGTLSPPISIQAESITGTGCDLKDGVLCGKFLGLVRGEVQAEPSQ